MADDLVAFISLVLVLLDKIDGPGESHLVYVFPDLFICHAYAVVYESYRFIVLIYVHRYGKLLVILQLCFAHGHELSHFCYGVIGIGNHFSDENVLVRIKPFLYYRQYILRMY